MQLAALDLADVAAGPLRRFRAVVSAQPEAVAVTGAGRTLSYAELAAEAAGVVNGLLGGLRARSEPVALLSGHHPGAVAAVLGVMASGHPLLVLDARTPVPRLRSFVDRVGARAIVCDPEHSASAAECGGQALVLVGADAPQRPRADPEALFAALPDPTASAVLSFTSGSTGVPKVVDTAAQQLVGDAWANSVAGGCYGAGDVVGHTLPMAFHAGLMATVAGPLVGATMAMYDVRADGVKGLPHFLAQHAVTVMQASPAILRAFVDSQPDPTLLTSVRTLTLAGEIVHGKDVAAARALLPPELAIHNRYGSSETGLIAEFVVGPGDPLPDGPLPVGAPIGNTRVVLRDDVGAPVPEGEPGTITVLRSHLATGYLADEERTRAAFGVEPDGTRWFRSSDLGRLDDAGRLVLLGRRDHSVKIRGYLVEPGEVDAVLFGLPQVAEAVVDGYTHPDGMVQLVAYVVARDGQLGAAAVRAAVRERLPAHMVPQTVIFLEALPRTERGKLDRAALPAPPAVRRGSGDDEESSDWERLIAEAFREALSLDAIGLDDDFFELGGDSLAVEALVAGVNTLGVAGEATSGLLVQAPTVRQFAARMGRRPEAGEDVLIPVKPRGGRTPLFVVAGGGGLGIAFTAMARRLHPQQPLWALQSRGLERRAVPDWSVEAAARRNVAELRRVQPDGPYLLAGHSFGGVVAFEMAHQLRRAGETVAMLIELDSFPPDPTVEQEQLEVRSLKNRVKQLVGLPLTGLRGRQAEQYWRFFRQSQLLHRRYTGPPWDGPTLLVFATSPQREQRARWQQFLTGQWREVEVAGDHLSMMREPFVVETAAAVQAALDDAPQ